ncbi:hypothetical protein [Dyella agri]|uniref:Uncharacterized protein n=1 Tax=Dyella agri TaxID=1926869 RepID=A0ABW8KIS0_9GAMM
MFPLERSIKGRTAEAIATIIFERGGYRLARFGIEELFREVKLLGDAEYQLLNLDPRLRSLPDFLVSTQNLDAAFQVEVKFRSNLYQEVREELAATMQGQRDNWPNTHVLLLVGYSPNGSNAKFFQDYVRIVPPSVSIEFIAEKQWHNQFWSQLPQVADVFPLIKKSDFDLDSVVPFLQELTKLGNGS